MGKLSHPIEFIAAYQIKSIKCSFLWTMSDCVKNTSISTSGFSHKNKSINI